MIPGLNSSQPLCKNKRGDIAAVSMCVLPEASGIHQHFIETSAPFRVLQTAAATAVFSIMMQSSSFVGKPLSVRLITCIIQPECNKKLTSDDSIVGSLINRSIELDDVTVAEDTEDLSLEKEYTRRTHDCFVIIVVVLQSYETRKKAVFKTISHNSST